MAGISITVNVDDAAVQAAFRRLQQRADNLEPVFADIAEMLLESTKQRFDDKQSPDGTLWAALAPKTIRRKKKPGSSILVESGMLIDQLVTESDGHHAAIGSNMIYAATHQFGAEERNIPARPFLGLSAQDEADIASLLLAWLQE